MSTVVYKLGYDKVGAEATLSGNAGYRMVLWQPSANSFIPPGKSKKYFIYWLFHRLKIFKNKDYAAVLVYDRQQLITSLLIVPAYYKWPFMEKNDLQLTYVMTKPDYRGKGIAEEAVRYALDSLKKEGRDFWYVTDTGNTASIKLCSKTGFQLFGYAQRQGLQKILRITETAQD